jgi:hypothetical protein
VLNSNTEYKINNVFVSDVGKAVSDYLVPECHKYERVSRL